MAVRCGVDYAVRGDIPELKRLWQLCFPEDTPEEIASFFHEVFRPEDCLVCREEAQPVSMAFLLPARLHTPEGLFPIHYLYAAATRPDRQGLGLFGKILQESFRVGRERGTEASCLLPAEEGLIPYYSRFGYRPFFRTVALRRRGSGVGKGLAYSDDTEEYHRRRARCLSSREWWVEWPLSLLSFAVKGAVKNGGGLWFARDAVALCETEERDGGSLLFVRELLCPPERREEVIQMLLSSYKTAGGKEEICLRLPPSPGKERGTAFGMLRPLTPRAEAWLQRDAAPYLGLAFD